MKKRLPYTNTYVCAYCDKAICAGGCDAEKAYLDSPNGAALHELKEIADALNLAEIEARNAATPIKTVISMRQTIALEKLAASLDIVIGLARAAWGRL